MKAARTWHCLSSKKPLIKSRVYWLHFQSWHSQSEQGTHHSDWHFENWTQSRLTTRRTACNLYLLGSNRSRAQSSHIQRELPGAVFGLERTHLYTFGYSIIVETDHQPNKDMENNHSNFKSKTAETTAGTQLIWCVHWVSERQRKCHSRCTLSSDPTQAWTSRPCYQSNRHWKDSSISHDMDSTCQYWEATRNMLGNIKWWNSTAISWNTAWRLV